MACVKVICNYMVSQLTVHLVVIFGDMLLATRWSTILQYTSKTTNARLDMHYAALCMYFRIIVTDIAIYSNLLDELNNNLCSYKILSEYSRFNYGHRG